MPSLIRLIVVLIFLAGLGYGAMFALVAFVEPTQKEVTIRIPSRDLFGEESTRLPTDSDTTTETTETPATDAPATDTGTDAGTGATTEDDQPE